MYSNLLVALSIAACFANMHMCMAEN